MRKLRPQSKVRGKKPFHISLLSSQFHFHSSLMNSFYIKFTHSFCCLPTTANISAAPLSDPLQGKTDLKDSPPRFCLKWLPSCAHTHGIQLLSWGNPRGEWRECARPTDHLAERVRRAWVRGCR